MPYCIDERKNSVKSILHNTVDESKNLTFDYTGNNDIYCLENQSSTVNPSFIRHSEKHKSNNTSEGGKDGVIISGNDNSYDMILAFFNKLASDVINKLFLSALHELIPFKDELADLKGIYTGNYTARRKIEEVIKILERLDTRDKSNNEIMCYRNVKDYLNSIVPVLTSIHNSWYHLEDAYDTISSDSSILLKVISIFDMFERLISIPQIAKMDNGKVKSLLVKFKQLFNLIQLMQSLPDDARIEDYLSLLNDNDFLLSVLKKSTLELGISLAKYATNAKPFPSDNDITMQIQWLAEILSDPVLYETIQPHVAMVVGGEENASRIFTLFNTMVQPGDFLINELRRIIPLHFIENAEIITIFDRLLNTDWSCKTGALVGLHSIGQITALATPFVLRQGINAVSHHYLPARVVSEIQQFCNEYSHNESWKDFCSRLGKHVLNTFSGTYESILENSYESLLAISGLDPVALATIRYAKIIQNHTSLEETLEWFISQDQSEDHELKYYHTQYLQAMINFRTFQCFNQGSDEEVECELRKLAAMLKNSQVVRTYPQLEVVLDLLPLLPALRKAKEIVGEQPPANNFLDWSSQWLKALANSKSSTLITLREKLYQNSIAWLVEAISASLSYLPDMLTLPSAAAGPIPASEPHAALGQEVTEEDFMAQGEQSNEKVQQKPMFSAMTNENSSMDSIIEITHDDLEFLKTIAPVNNHGNNVLLASGIISGITIAAALWNIRKNRKLHYTTIKQNDEEAENKNNNEQPNLGNNKSLYQYLTPALLTLGVAAPIAGGVYKYYSESDSRELMKDDKNRIDNIVSRIEEVENNADTGHKRMRRSAAEVSTSVSTTSQPTDVPSHLKKLLNFDSYSVNIEYIIKNLILNIVRNKTTIHKWSFYSRLYKKIISYLKTEHKNGNGCQDDEELLSVAKECVENILRISDSEPSKKLKWKDNESKGKLLNYALNEVNVKNITTGMENYFSSLSESEWRQLYNGSVPDDDFRAIYFNGMGNINTYAIFNYALGLAVTAKRSEINEIKTNWYVAFSYYEMLNLISDESGISKEEWADVMGVYSDLIIFRFIFESIISFNPEKINDLKVGFSKVEFLNKMHSSLSDSFKSRDNKVLSGNIDVENDMSEYYAVSTGILKDKRKNSHFQQAMDMFKIEEQKELKKKTSRSDDPMNVYLLCLTAIKLKFLNLNRKLEALDDECLIPNPILKQDHEIYRKGQAICEYYITKQNELTTATSGKSNYTLSHLKEAHDDFLKGKGYFYAITNALAYAYNKSINEITGTNSKEAAKLYKQFIMATEIFNNRDDLSGDNLKLFAFQYAIFIITSKHDFDFISWDMIIRDLADNQALREKNIPVLDKSSEVRGFNNNKKYTSIHNILPYSNFDPEEKKREDEKNTKQKNIKKTCENSSQIPRFNLACVDFQGVISTITNAFTIEESGSSTFTDCNLSHLLVRKKRQAEMFLLHDYAKPLPKLTNENSPEFKYNKQFSQYKNDGSIDVESVDDANKVILKYYDNDPWLFESSFGKGKIISYKMQYFVEGEVKGRGKWILLPGRVYIFRDYTNQVKVFSTIIGSYQLLDSNPTFNDLYNNVGSFEPCTYNGARNRHVEMSVTSLGFNFNAPNNSQVGFVYDKEITDKHQVKSFIKFGIKESLTERADILKKVQKAPEDISIISIFTSMIPFYDILHKLSIDPDYSPDISDVLLESMSLASLALGAPGVTKAVIGSTSSLLKAAKAMKVAGAPRLKIIEELTKKIAVGAVVAGKKITKNAIEEIIFNSIPFADISIKIFAKMTKGKLRRAFSPNEIEQFKISKLLTLGDFSAAISSYKDYADISEEKTISSATANLLFNRTPFTTSELSGESSGVKRIVYNYMKIKNKDKLEEEVVSIKPAALDDKNGTSIYFVKRNDNIVIPKKIGNLKPSEIFFENTAEQHLFIEDIDDNSIRVYNAASEAFGRELDGKLLTTEPQHSISKRALKRNYSFNRMIYREGRWQLDTQQTQANLKISHSILQIDGSGLGIVKTESKGISSLPSRDYTINVDASWRVLDNNNTFKPSHGKDYHQGIYTDESNNYYLKADGAYYRVIRDDALNSWVMVGQEKNGISITGEATRKKIIKEKPYTYYEGRSIPVRYNNGLWYYNETVPDGRFGYDNYKMKKLEWLDLEANMAFNNFKAKSGLNKIINEKSRNVAELTKELIAKSLPNVLKKNAAYAGVAYINADKDKNKFLSNFVNLPGSLSPKNMFPGTEISDVKTGKNFTFDRALGPFKKFSALSEPERKKKLEKLKYDPIRTEGESLHYKINDEEMFIGEIKKLYNKNDNPMHPEIEKRIRSFLKENNYQLSVFEGIPGLHAEVQALNAMINKLIKSQGESFNLSQAVSECYIFTRRLVGDLNKEFAACYNCSGILSGLEQIPTRKVDINLRFSK